MKGMALSRENGEQTEGAEARRYRTGFSRSPSRHAFLVNWALRHLSRIYTREQGLSILMISSTLNSEGCVFELAPTLT